MIWCLMVIGLWGICVALTLAGTIAYAIESKKQDYSNAYEGLFNAAGAGTIIALIATILLLFIGSMFWTSNYGERAELEAFYTTNVQNYADATNMSNNILLQAKFAEGLGSIGEGLAYQGQSAEVTKSIMNWRDSVNEYNLDLASYKACRENPWSSWFYYDIDAEYLTIR